MLESESNNTILPSLSKLQSQQLSGKKYIHSTSLEEFISSSHNKDNSLQNKPLNSSQLITIPTTPVKRRRHRNDVLSTSQNKHKSYTNKSTQRKMNRSESGLDPLSSSIRNKHTDNTRKDCVPSPVKLPGIKLAAPSVSKFELSKEKLFKYRQWFMSIDTDDSGSLDKGELFESFVASGVVASEKICTKLFELMDVDGSGEVDFDNFIR